MAKGCDPKSPKATSGQHVCNEKTGNWVLMTGKIGKEIMGGAASPKERRCNASSPKATSGRHVCNKKTGRWVLATGKIGKQFPKSKSPMRGSPKGKTPMRSPTGKSLIRYSSKGKTPVRRSPGSESSTLRSISSSIPYIKAKVDIQPHQVRFAKAFMRMTDNPKEEKHGAIAAHSLGSGKTLTAITTSQMYLHKYPDDKIIVITPASLITNFQKEMDKWGVKNKDKYSFFTYDGFKNNPANCKNSLLIVDEAHNLRTAIKIDETQRKKLGKAKQNPRGVTMKQQGDKFVISGGFTKDTSLNVVERAFPGYEITLTKATFKIVGNMSKRDSMINQFHHYIHLFFDPRRGTSKNKGVKVAEVIHCAKRARFCLLLTGTPVVNSVYDMENLMAIVYRRDPHPRTKFEKMNADEMDAYFRCTMSIYNTRDNIQVKHDFPETIEHNVYLTMTPGYLAKYMIVENNLMDRLNALGFNSEKDITTFYNGLRQATTKLDAEKSPKIMWIMNLLNNSEPREKFVIFSHFVESGVGLLVRLLDSANIGYRVISGEISKLKRQKFVDEYNRNEIKVMIITKAGGEGLNLLETRGVVLVEPSWNETISNQVVGRAVRYKSHVNLPKENQIVHIYRLYMLKPIENQMMNRTLGTHSLVEVVQMIENEAKDEKPSIDIFLKAHSLEKQDKLDRFMEFCQSIPSFEDCYIR